jgi:hypothetical protein
MWSTLKPIRASGSPYIYWSEAYRIPLQESAGPQLFWNYYWMVKNIGLAEGQAYSQWFGSDGNALQSIFNVQDDGFGNLNITMNPLRQYPGDSNLNTTLNNLRYCLYYYSEIGNRYTQLESPFNVSQTRMFTGFTKNGTVTTVVVDPYPGYRAIVPPTPVVPPVVIPIESGDTYIGDE